jgi:ribonuclease Z
MSLATGFTWTHKNIRLVGYSVAGISTSIVFPDADVCFDVAQGLPFQMNIPTICISHGHMDHASGLPYVISQKSMMSQTPPTVYMPETLVKPMTSIMRLYEQIDEFEYSYSFQTIRPGEEAPLKHPYFFKTFKTSHRVDSQGYTVFERKKRLKAEFRELEPKDLAQLRKDGVALEEQWSEPILSFTGDTRIEFLDDPQVRNSRVVVMEVTYWDDKKSVENARTWGHIHLDELIPRLETLKCEKIVLIHASARYTTPRLKEILDARIPEHFKHRVELFPRPL